VDIYIKWNKYINIIYDSMIEIQLDKSRKVEFTMRAFRAFQLKTGLSILNDGIKNIDENVMVELTYAGLCAADKEFELSSDEVADYLDFAMFEKVMTELVGGVEKLSGTAEKK